MLNEKSHILVVDDDDQIRILLKNYLIESNFFVSSASNAKEARTLIENFIFDAIILDVMMPGENGVSLTKHIKSITLSPVILLSAMGEADDRVKGLFSGADDYIVKPFDPRELLLRLQKLISKTKLSMASLSTNINESDVYFDITKNILYKHGRPLHLTGTEAKIMRILALKKGQIVERDVLANECGELNPRSIDVIISRIRHKIEIDPKQPVYIQNARGMGYVFYC